MASGASYSETARLNVTYEQENGSRTFNSVIPLSSRSARGLASPRQPPTPAGQRQIIRVIGAALVFALLIATMVALLAAVIVRCRQHGGPGCLIPKKAVDAPWGGAGLWPASKVVSRIAFGSCSAYDIRNQSIWEQGVIPSQPDVWLWVGDMYYADEPEYNCNPANVNASGCQCEATWLKQPPYMCMAGDMDNARSKMIAQVLQPGYQAYLQYSCPSYDASGTAVPPGDDLSACPRPVLGTYDDHDFAVNNFNRRLPNKHLLKQIYLDALGVSATSPRRAAQQGVQWHYTFNPGTRQAVDLVLLDERYDRAPLPCEVRGDWCRNVVLKDRRHSSYGWCRDYLYTGGVTGQQGSCCRADADIFYGWCRQTGSRADPQWEVACNQSSPRFGSQPLVVRNGKLQPRNVEEDASEAQEGSSFCEVLGPRQRAWLEGVLSSSTAPVRLIASGSVVLGSSGLGNNTAENGWMGYCSGDDWDCYRPAQLALLATLQRHAARHGGCWIVLTGDYHYSDIKVAKPGADSAYAAAYGTAEWATPLYQVMASGLTNSTARPNAPCAGYRRESSGLRVEGECGFVALASFGMLEFDWRARTLSMQIRGAEAPHGGAVLQQLTISLDTCQPLQGR